MAYCTNIELTLLTGTTLSTDTQDAIIEQADRKINARLRTEGLVPPTEDDDLKAASLDLSHVAVLMHPDNPSGASSVKLGDVTVARAWAATLTSLEKSAWQSVGAYISANVAVCPIPDISIVGRRGQRIGEHEEMLEATEDEY